jgi:hypothetical protein
MCHSLRHEAANWPPIPFSTLLLDIPPTRVLTLLGLMVLDISFMKRSACSGLEYMKRVLIEKIQKGSVAMGRFTGKTIGSHI